jgi:exodeoxyribonuclease V gamma subunit
MVPMRSVPHRVVCLVGLDDGIFPRQGVPDGDDALARDPMTGERDVRSEDRQLLLDAINAASDTVVITYTGFSDSSGQHRPPSVPLLELLDAVDSTTPVNVRERVVTKHPLQPFDIRNAMPGELGIPGQPFTFDSTIPPAARAAGGGSRPAPMPFLPRHPLPAPTPADVTIEELVTFFKDPVKGFFRALDYTLPWDVDGLKDDIPVGLDALEKWGVGQRLLDDSLGGLDVDVAAQIEWRRGAVPPGKLGWGKVKEAREQTRPIAEAAAECRAEERTPVDVDVELDDGRRLVGTISPVYNTGLVSATFSKLGPKHLVEAWIRLLALKAALPSEAWTVVCVGRGERNSNTVGTKTLAAPDDPIGILRDLAEIYDAGTLEPLPLPLKTSYEWAWARFRDREPNKAAEARWKGSNFFEGDCGDRAAVAVWGKRAPFSVLLGAPREGEATRGEQTRLGALAMRLWFPVLTAEVKKTRNWAK